MTRARSFPRLPRGLATRVALAYALLAGLWILLSDRALAALVSDPDLHLELSVVKGWGFVVVTGGLLYAYLASQADARLALLDATLQARVVPFRWVAEQDRWIFDALAAQVLDLPPEDLSGVRSVERLLHPQDLHRLSQARVAAKAGNLGTFEARILRRDGSELWTQWSLQQSEEGFHGVVQDISQMHETRTRLLNLQKRELVTLMASGLAHDLRNLLQAIHGSAEIMAEELGDRPEGRRIDTLKRASERAHDLVQRFVKVARERCDTCPESSDLNAQVAEAALLLGLALPKGLQLETELASDLPCTPFDAGQILQVLMNLGLNARDAQGDTGLIRFRTGVEQIPGEARPFIYAEVEDQGPGIPPEVQERLFEPFFSTKGTGTGLGLITAKSIARAHGGRLTFESAPGRGTRFRLSLPVDPNQAA